MATPAPSPTILGSTRIIGTPAFLAAGLALKSTNRRKNPVDGESRVYTYVGTQAAVYAAYATINLTDYLEVEIDETNAPEYRLVVNAPDDSILNSVTNYEVLNDVQILGTVQCDRARALSVTTLHDVRDRVSKGKDASGVGLSGDALGLYLALSRQIDTFPRDAFVYRVTKVISRNYALKVAYGNRNRVYKTTQVLNETQPPPGIVFSLTDLQADSTSGGPNDISENFPNGELGTVYGWLKGVSSVQRVAGFRIAVTTEFKMTEAVPFIYKSAT